MNLTIASFAVIASLSNISTSSVGFHQIQATQASAFSKDEIVEILQTKQHANQTLDNFAIVIPALTVEHNLQMPKVVLAPTNNTLSVRSKKQLNADE